MIEIFDQDWKCTFKFEHDSHEVPRLIEEIKESATSKGIVAFDFETTSLSNKDKVDPFVDNIYSCSFCSDDVSRAFRIDKTTMPAIQELFKWLIEDRTIRKLVFNLKFDLKLMWRITGVIPDCTDPSWEDAMVMSYLLNENRSHALKKDCSHYLDIDGHKYESRLSDIKKIGDIDWMIGAQYNCADSWMTLKLRNKLLPMIVAQGIDKLHDRLYIPFNLILLETEIHGFPVDVKFFEGLRGNLQAEHNKLKEFLVAKSGTVAVVRKRKGLEVISNEKFSPSSDAHVRTMICNLGLADKIKDKTKTGLMSVDKDSLESIAKKDKTGFVRTMAEYKKCNTQLKYVVGVMKKIRPDNTIKTKFNLCITRTGRLSSSGPNLQNLTRGRGIRDAFVSMADYVLVIADFSQTELRIAAVESGDEVMLGVFDRGGDIHSRTAIEAYKLDCLEKEVKKLHKDKRDNSKIINFGILYGMTDETLADKLGCSVAEASTVRMNIFASYSKLAEDIENTIQTALAQEYVVNLFGRRRRLPGLNALYNKYGRGYPKVAHMLREAYNFKIQSGGVDVTDYAIVKIKKRCVKEGIYAPLLAQVHDEMIFMLHKSMVDKFIPLMKEEAECVLRHNNAWYKIPLEETVVNRWGVKYEGKPLSIFISKNFNPWDDGFDTDAEDDDFKDLTSEDESLESDESKQMGVA